MKTNCPQCNKQIESKYSDKEELHYFYCSNCKIGGKGKTEKDAEKEFKKQGGKLTTTAIIEIPKNKNEFVLMCRQKADEYMNSAPQWIDKPYTEKIYKKNIKYILNADFKDAWNTTEGQESIVDAFEKATSICATLGEMGDIVPFGKTVEYIPNMVAFNFVLTEGANAPFKRIAIDVIHENDIFDLRSDKDGNFILEFKKIGFPRGEIVGVVVRGWFSSDGVCIGRAYDKKLLLEKAEKYSKTHQYYLKDLAELRKARAEGRDYIEKEFEGPNGKYKRKFYESDIISPYVGADAGEMLSKLAGKSFFSLYFRTRDARNMKSEWQNEPEEKEQTPEELLKPMIDVSDIPQKEKIKDAEIIPEKQNDLFRGEKI